MTMTEAQAHQLIELTLRAEGAEEELEWIMGHPYRHLWDRIRQGWLRASFERRLFWVGLCWGSLVGLYEIATVVL